MSSPTPRVPGTPDEDVWTRIDRVVERFEEAWRRGPRPAVEDYLPPGDRPHELLLELLLAELELRLKAGEPARLEDYLPRFPALAADPALVLRCLAQECELRGRRSPPPTLQEYQLRFPQYGERLAEVLPLGGGPRIPGFVVLGEVGRGGMGVVYKARQERLGRLVALKVVRGDAAPEGARLLPEARAAARLQHPNVVGVHEVGEHQGQPYLVLEYVEGCSLRERLADGPLPPGEAAALLETLARAVHFAHQQGIIHRDLKPGNVLLTADGCPKVTDFGLAKHLDAAGDLTATGTVLGTPGYMAPEQAEGRTRDVGPWTDTYALGAIFYEMLTARPPFCAATPLEALRRVAAEDPLPPRRLAPRLPRDLETICLKCLHKEPHQRYASALDLAEDVARFRAGKPIRARPVSPWGRVARWARRRPSWAALVAVSLLACLALGALAIHYTAATARHAADLEHSLRATDRARADAQHSERQVRRHLYAADLSRAFQYWEGGDVAGMRALLAFHRPRGPGPGADWRGFEWHYLDRLDRQSTANTVTTFPHELSAAAFTPDGTTLATGGPDGTVGLWDVATWRARGTFRRHRGAVHWLAFDRAGRVLASAGADGTVGVCDAATGAVRFDLPRPDAHLGRAALSPDGRLLAVAWKDHSVRLWDVARGKERSLPPPVHIPAASLAFTADGKMLVLARAGGFGLEWWDVNAASLTRRGRPQDIDLLHFPWSADGRLFAAGDARGTLNVMDPAGNVVAALRGHTARVRAVALAPDGQSLASAGDDTVVRMWDRRTGVLLNAFRGHTDQVVGLAFSPGGKLLSVGRDRTVKSWDPALTQGRRSLVTGPLAAGPLAFSPKGGLLAVARRDGTVTLIDPASGQGRVTLPGHAGGVGCLAFSPDGGTLATAGADRRLRLWDMARGRPRAAVPLGDGEVCCLAFSPDGRVLAYGGEDRQVRLWDVAGGRERACLAGHPGAVAALAFSPDGKTLATGCRGGHLKLWDWAAARERRSLVQGTAVLALAYSPDGRLLVSGEAGGAVSLRDPLTGQRRALPGRPGVPVRSLAFSPDGRTLAWVEDRIVHLHAVAGPASRALTLGTGGVFLRLAYAPAGDLLATTNEDGSVHVWDPTRSRMLRPPGQPLRPVTGLAFSPDGKTLVTASEDYPVSLRHDYPLARTYALGLVRGSCAESVVLWDVASGKRTAFLPAPHPFGVGPVAFAPDGRTVAAGTSGGMVWRWDARTGRDRGSLPVSPRARTNLLAYQLASNQPFIPSFPDCEKDRVRALACSPDGRLLAAAIRDGPVKLLATDRGHEETALPAEVRDAHCLAFSPDGQVLATHAGADVRLWDMTARRWQAVLRGHREEVRSLAFTPDGRTLVSGSRDGQVKVWDLRVGRTAETLIGHAGAVAALAVSPDGRTLATGSSDGTVRLWDLFGKRQLGTLRGHSGPVTCLAFSPDGKALASGGHTPDVRGEVFFWER